ncbi:hypothetical protein SERLA73DRAFT_68220 [Serpula lacrymans var. lacrymans S7.3]|uniref:Uncharacterized protein n=2 Tax=Serpula lacrymans var. lacrymans TaxID=341189 RepID=F8PHK0_SERL3|nr:uncharacterized protein SERLADRAFT_431955 [Serpula lacrymans var. lacrymans S7.9]EGO04532.1 hypothetical protein SERLA73DRAFT_68220 [Serpula lacrymans var. lacrymans S7.3]EGO30415.1 hypothetical protein SERLADRAFT_431955 [Serpula lacrymans var. lacrymans S7.9]
MLFSPSSSTWHDTVRKYQIAADQFLETQAYQNELVGQIEGLLAKEHVHISQQHKLEGKIRRYEDNMQRLTEENALNSQNSSAAGISTIYPSDSASHAANTSQAKSVVFTHESLPRPDKYLFEVLWHFDDCKEDEDSGLTAQNPARPAMECAIRHADGTMITSNEWSAIKASTRLAQFKLEQLPLPKH